MNPQLLCSLACSPHHQALHGLAVPQLHGQQCNSPTLKATTPQLPHPSCTLGRLHTTQPPAAAETTPLPVRSGTGFAASTHTIFHLSNQPGWLKLCNLIVLPCHLQRTWVYLSMKSRALGTLWSPRWITEDPTQPPMRCWHLDRMPRMARPTESAACTLFMPCPVLTSLQPRSQSQACSSSTGGGPGPEGSCAMVGHGEQRPLLLRACTRAQREGPAASAHGPGGQFMVLSSPEGRLHL